MITYHLQIQWALEGKSLSMFIMSPYTVGVTSVREKYQVSYFRFGLTIYQSHDHFQVGFLISIQIKTKFNKSSSLRSCRSPRSHQ